jgi:hypothetical protein
MGKYYIAFVLLVNRTQNRIAIQYILGIEYHTIIFRYIYLWFQYLLAEVVNAFDILGLGLTSFGDSRAAARPLPVLVLLVVLLLLLLPLPLLLPEFGVAVLDIFLDGGRLLR